MKIVWKKGWAALCSFFNVLMRLFNISCEQQRYFPVSIVNKGLRLCVVLLNVNRKRSIHCQQWTEASPTRLHLGSWSNSKLKVWSGHSEFNPLLNHHLTTVIIPTWCPSPLLMWFLHKAAHMQTGICKHRAESGHYSIRSDSSTQNWSKWKLSESFHLLL